MNGNRTKVVLTVDVEPSIAGAFIEGAGYQPLIDEPVAGTVAGRSEALGFIIETLCRYGLTGTFFVETLHRAYFPASAMGRYVDALLRAGQDVQLHLHPCWLLFRPGVPKHPGILADRCDMMAKEELAGFIEEGCETLRSWTGTRPTGMRTGNFATALSVFEAMHDAGLRRASNICVGVRVPPEAELEVAGGVHEFAGVRELPVTCFSDVGPVGRGRARPMAVTALSSGELIRVLKIAHARGNKVVVILTHPFEFLKTNDFRYGGLRANRIVQRRLKKLCAFLAANGDKFEVVPLSRAADDPSGAAPWTEMSGSWVSSIYRASQNYLNDRVKFL